METMNASNKMLNFIKALADRERLQIVGILARESATLEELAGVLAFNPKALARHLENLKRAGLVAAHPDTDPVKYSLVTRELETLARQVLSGTRPVPEIKGDLEEDDRKIVANYTGQDGKLKQIPTQQKKILPILRYIAPSFEQDREYTEKEVNEILKRFNPDSASLRRYLVDFGFLERDKVGATYRRAGEGK